MTDKNVQYLTQGASIADLSALISSGADRITVRGFGTFEVYERDAFQTTNPVTRERMDIPALRCVSFKASRALKDALRQ